MLLTGYDERRRTCRPSESSARPRARGRTPRGRSRRRRRCATSGCCATWPIEAWPSTIAATRRTGAGRRIASRPARRTPRPSRRPSRPSRSAVAASLAAGERALVLGGDCTVGLGAVRALAATPGYGLLYLDMHSDMNTPESVRDGALDWMGVAHLLGLTTRCRRWCRPSRCCRSSSRSSASRSRRRRPWERQSDRRPRHRDDVGRGADRQSGPGGGGGAGGAAGRHASASRCTSTSTSIDFVDAPLSQNTGRNVGVPLASAFAALETLLADPRVATLTVTELNPLHGAEDGSTLQAFARAWRRRSRPGRRRRDARPRAMAESDAVQPAIAARSVTRSVRFARRHSPSHGVAITVSCRSHGPLGQWGAKSTHDGRPPRCRFGAWCETASPASSELELPTPREPTSSVHVTERCRHSARAVLRSGRW